MEETSPTGSPGPDAPACPEPIPADRADPPEVEADPPAGAGAPASFVPSESQATSAARDEAGGETGEDVDAGRGAADAEGRGEAVADELPALDPLVLAFTEIEALRADVAERDRRLQETLDAYRAAVADMAATKERMRRDQDKVLRRERGVFVGELLEVLDNLDRSVDGARRTGNLEALIAGLELVQKVFLDKLRQAGVERIPTAGSRFDPKLHEAIGTVPVQSPEQDQVVFHEARSGYTYSGEVLRAAQVIVGASPEG